MISLSARYDPDFDLDSEGGLIGVLFRLSRLKDDLGFATPSCCLSANPKSDHTCNQPLKKTLKIRMKYKHPITQ
jgi:hypothetical protein